MRILSFGWGTGVTFARQCRSDIRGPPDERKRACIGAPTGSEGAGNPFLDPTYAATASLSYSTSHTQLNFTAKVFERDPYS